MTQNQLAYQSNIERRRNDQAVEAETNRTNLAKEAETKRANMVKEFETNRSNLANEAIKSQEVETKREANRIQEEMNKHKMRQDIHNNANDFISTIRNIASEGSDRFVKIFSGGKKK